MCKCARRCGCIPVRIKGVKQPCRHHDYKCEDRPKKTSRNRSLTKRRRKTSGRTGRRLVRSKRRKSSYKKSRKGSRKKSKYEIKLEKRNKHLENQLIHFHLKLYLINDILQIITKYLN